jgi:hypothetical protein
MKDVQILELDRIQGFQSFDMNIIVSCNYHSRINDKNKEEQIQIVSKEYLQ